LALSTELFLVNIEIPGLKGALPFSALERVLKGTIWKGGFLFGVEWSIILQ
jgi:hypothetical protein